MQLTRASGTPARTAITGMVPVQGSRDFVLYALHSLDKKQFVFRAVWSLRDGHYKIGVFDRILGH